MGKNGGKNKKVEFGYSLSDSHVHHGRQSLSPKPPDKDNEVFMSMAQELKDEGNKLFQVRDIEGALLKYEKAIKLLPKNHVDVSHLRSNMATCYMQMGLSEYLKAIHECNLALEVTPKYGKALLKRAKCYEGLNRLDLCLRDVNLVLKMEPNNVMAGEVLERVTKALQQRGLKVTDETIELPADYEEPPNVPLVSKGNFTKKKSKKLQQKKKVSEEFEDKVVECDSQEKNAEDKLVVEEKITRMEEEPNRTIKLVFEDDIRWVQVPVNYNFSLLTIAIKERFAGLGDFVIKYRDAEDDLVSVTSDKELKWAEEAAQSTGSLRLYLTQVKPSVLECDKQKFSFNNGINDKIKELKSRSCSIDEWIVEFAKLFKDHVGLETDSYLNLHELGTKTCSEAMEDTVTSDEAQCLFDMAGRTFQEMAALAMLNWGNVHMSRVKKKMHLSDDASRETVMEHIKVAYDWAQKEYSLARRRYEQALAVKPDFYEGFLALGHQQFEQARLNWYYAISINVDFENWYSEKVIQLYNCAEDNMERGMKLWEEFEEQRVNRLNAIKTDSHMDNINGLFEGVSVEEANEQAKSIKTQINVLWGTMLYERSVMEFKLSIPVWQECLEVAIEKFVLAGASPTDIAVMIKNHVSNGGVLEGLGFKIDEIVEAWNEMHEAKKHHSRVTSFRLEPLLRRRVSKLYHVFEVA